MAPSVSEGTIPKLLGGKSETINRKGCNYNRSGNGQGEFEGELFSKSVSKNPKEINN